MVQNSEAGSSSEELSLILNVEAKHALLIETRKSHLKRERLHGRWYYFSKRQIQNTEQRKLRKKLFLEYPGISTPVAAEIPELRKSLNVFFKILDERQRRLFAGLPSFQIGRGGDKIIAQILNLDVHTVAKGRFELFSKESTGSYVRKAINGRKRIEKKCPK